MLDAFSLITLGINACFKIGEWNLHHVLTFSDKFLYYFLILEYRKNFTPLRNNM